MVETAEKEECSEMVLKNAEQVLSKYVDKFGSLILHGDLLSIASAENAIRLREYYEMIKSIKQCKPINPFGNGNILLFKIAL